MDIQQYFSFVAALVFVVALIFLLAWVAKRFGLGGVTPVAGRQKRLALVDTLPIDAKRRLVLVRRDNVEHLVLLGPSGDTVVETGVSSAFPAVVASIQKDEEEAGE